MAQNYGAIVPYGQKRSITIDLNNDGFADGEMHGAPSVAVIDTSQSQSVWVWLKVIPSLLRHQGLHVFLAIVILTVLIPTGFHSFAAMFRPTPRYLEAKDGGAAGAFAPWVWVPNIITGVREPLGNTVGNIQDAAIDNNGDISKASSLSLRSRTKVSID